ncbi:S24 family peptidase [Novosphingobium soli]|uniref:Helix-turn-helix transcriptional regulator n=1 Tax=Novosphingobium soli TaxID=574956 RepID=A0ABV6CVF0_9SPHN
MRDDATPLQQFIRAAVALMPQKRDHYDKILQEKLGTKGKPIYDIDRGKSKNPSLAQLNAISELLGQPRQLFERAIAGEPVEPVGSSVATAVPGARSVADIVPAEDVVYIQKLDLSLSMGPGTHIDDWVEAEPVAFDLAFIRSVTRTASDRLKLVTGIGDSMYPTLNWGDVILIDTTERQLARQDAVYWIDVYGAAGLKRLRNVGRSRVLVISDNPNVPDMEVDAADLRIQGRAIWLARGI